MKTDIKKTKYVEDSLRLKIERIRGQCLNERSTFLDHWYQLGSFIFPRRTRFYTTDVDRGNRRNMQIIDSTGGLAARTLRSGMMSGFTSPSRSWFRMTTVDPDLAKLDSVKEWLYDVTWRMSEIFLRSNLYNSLQTVYGDMGVFGTSAMLIEEDFDRVIHTYPFVIGSYYLIANDKLKINGFLRDFRLTVRQIVEKWVIQEDMSMDWSNVSSLVYNLWHSNQTEAWIELTHAILPNEDYDPDSMRSDKKRYLSVYYERGSSTASYTLSQVDTSKILQKKGYDRFRVLAPRWDVSGEDIYGTYCPGMEALGDIQQLQMMERRGMQALEKLINPAMVGPSSLRNQKASVLPGDITYVDVRDGQQSFSPAYQIQPNFQQLELKENEIRSRVDKSFFKDLWLAVSDLDKGNVTAEEIRALKEEKLQEIGPVVDRLNQELLDPLIEITFEIMQQQKLVPPPPQEMSKMPLRVEYTSIMSQAQRALGASTIDRFVDLGTKVAELKPQDPSTLDKIDFDEMIERYGEDLTLPPGIVLDDKKVAKIRQARAKQAQQQAHAAQMEQASKTAKNLGDADTSGGNALSDLIDQGNAGSMQ